MPKGAVAGMPVRGGLLPVLKSGLLFHRECNILFS